MLDVNVRLKIEPDGAGGFVTTSPDVPGLVLSTKSPSDAVALAPGVIRDMVEVWGEAGHPLPPSLRDRLPDDEPLSLEIPVGLHEEPVSG
jgi:predicted RNase H-like HicB family nuclease